MLTVYNTTFKRYVDCTQHHFQEICWLYTTLLSRDMLTVHNTAFKRYVDCTQHRFQEILYMATFPGEDLSYNCHLECDFLEYAMVQSASNKSLTKWFSEKTLVWLIAPVPEKSTLFEMGFWLHHLIKSVRLFIISIFIMCPTAINTLNSTVRWLSEASRQSITIFSDLTQCNESLCLCCFGIDISISNQVNLVYL